jgi:hypothetical protein
VNCYAGMEWWLAVAALSHNQLCFCGAGLSIMFDTYDNTGGVVCSCCRAVVVVIFILVATPVVLTVSTLC